MLLGQLPKFKYGLWISSTIASVLSVLTLVTVGDYINVLAFRNYMKIFTWCRGKYVHGERQGDRMKDCAQQMGQNQ